MNVRPLGFALLLFASSASGAFGAARLGSVFSRDVDVPAAGWVRVPLDLAAVRHMAPDGRDLRIYDSNGQGVAVAIEEAPREVGLRPVRVVEVVRDASAASAASGGGWSLLFDVGEGAPAHQRLRFDIAKLVAAPAVRLESGPDGSNWQLLAEGDLFRLADPASPGVKGNKSNDRLAATTLSYPATSDRFLRLSWPASAGFPEVRTVEVETSPGPSIEVATADVRCDPRNPTATRCRIAMPAAGQLLRRLTVEIEGQGAVGYRFDQPLVGRFETLAEGLWPRSAARTRHAIELGAEGRRIAGDFLRLDFFGTAPRLVGVRVEISLREAVFRAPAAGRYEIRYGAAPSPIVTASGDLREDDSAARLSAGPERESPAPPLPPVAGLGKPLLLERFGRSWEVLAPGLVAGEVVRLELPDEVYAATRGSLDGLRLAVGRRQLPYVLSVGRAPVLVQEALGKSPEPEREGRASRFEVELPEPWLPLTAVEMEKAAGPMDRQVSLLSLGRPGPNAEIEARSLTSASWSCATLTLLPCRLGIPLEAAGRERLAIRIDDGDDPPLAAVDVAVYRRSDALVFVWPTGGKVRLLAAREGIAAPDYDLANSSEDLLGRPWHPADLAPILAKSGSKVGKWLLPGALALAGIGLLLLLRRILTAAD